MIPWPIILVNDEAVDALSMIVRRAAAESRGGRLCAKVLKDLIGTHFRESEVCRPASLIPSGVYLGTSRRRANARVRLTTIRRHRAVQHHVSVPKVGQGVNSVAGTILVARTQPEFWNDHTFRALQR